MEGLHNSPYFSCPHGLALTPGLLPVNFTASYIFNFIINTSLYLHQPALEWCVAAYSICFLPAALAILLNLGKWQCRLPGPFSLPQLVLTLLSVLLYVSAWSSGHSTSSVRSLADTPRGPVIKAAQISPTQPVLLKQRLAVAILTAINLLI